MSLPPLTRPMEGTTPRSTRQILDELDSLMDQMLALPVVEDPAHSPPPPALTATLTFLEPTPSPVPQTVTSRPNAAEIPIHRTGVAAQVVEAVPDDTAIDVELEPLDFDDVVEIGDDVLINDGTPHDIRPRPVVRPLAEPKPRISFEAAGLRPASRPLPPSTASWHVRTAILWDRGFRRLTRKFGFLGWIMRTTLGRTLLGLAGFALWLAAIVWLVTDSLQWPR